VPFGWRRRAGCRISLVSLVAYAKEVFDAYTDDEWPFAGGPDVEGDCCVHMTIAWDAWVAEAPKLIEHAHRRGLVLRASGFALGSRTPSKADRRRGPRHSGSLPARGLASTGRSGSRSMTPARTTLGSSTRCDPMEAVSAGSATTATTRPCHATVTGLSYLCLRRCLRSAA
jgi:hypothetical protein